MSVETILHALANSLNLNEALFEQYSKLADKTGPRDEKGKAMARLLVDEVLKPCAKARAELLSWKEKYSDRPEADIDHPSWGWVDEHGNHFRVPDEVVAAIRRESCARVSRSLGEKEGKIDCLTDYLCKAIMKDEPESAAIKAVRSPPVSCLRCSAFKEGLKNTTVCSHCGPPAWEGFTEDESGKPDEPKAEGTA